MTMPPVRSMFVTALAWAFIGVGALGACFFALISFVSSVSHRLSETGSSQLHQQMHQVTQAMNTLPPPWPWIYAHEAQLLLLGSALALIHLACALGLLWRRRWARVGFIGLMLLDMLLQLLMIPYSLVVQPTVAKSVLTQMPAQMPPAFASWMSHVMAFQQIEAMVRPVVLVVVFAWIAWRLRSPAVRQEFADGSSSGAQA